ncbi:hypothetical protein ABPG75_010434 [Micractinium tetrahymenae]
MDRQAAARGRQQAEAAAMVLHAALVCLNRGGACREPLTPGMFARPNLKGLQAALYLLHLRIRGAARTKKELQHIYPVLEPAQAREFKAAMHAWIRELGAAGAVSADTVKYFASGYQGSSSQRTVLMLLDLCAVALAKELGVEGPHATLPGAAELQPGAAAATSSAGSSTHAAAALRQGQARLDAVVAAMQRLKQLHTQAAGQLAGGQAASGSAAQALAPRLPPLFAGSQASMRRGELVQELLTNGPPLTSKPEAVGPESWADLLAAGRGAPAAPAAAAPASPLLARRLSNPAQEASNFAAEGLAADSDVLAVHRVLAQRLTAAASTLQGAAAAGTAPSSAEVRGALAEAAACREALMLSVRQELSAAKLREELQAHSGPRHALLQLLPPSQPPCNPVLEGLQAAQSAASAAAAAAGGCCGWRPPDAAAVQALRQSMWRRARTAACDCSEPNSTAAAAAAAAAHEPMQMHAAPSSPSAQQLARDPAGPAHGSSSSKAPQPVRRAAASRALDSPTLADVVSIGSRGLALAGLLSDEQLYELPLAAAEADSPWPEQRLQDSPLPQAAAGGSSEATPVSHMVRPAGSSRFAAGGSGGEPTGTPARSPVLQPVQARLPQLQQRDEQGSTALLASCFKSKAGGLDLGLSPFASPLVAPAPLDSPFAAASRQPPQAHTQPQRWALSAASPSGAADLGSPRSSGGSMGRRRSALHTTSSPACEGARQRGAALAASPLVTLPRSLMATPDGPRPTNHMHGGHGDRSGASSKPPRGSIMSGVEAASAVEALRQRMARAGLGPPGRR